MGRTSSIDEATGKRLIAAYGRSKSVRAAAVECGVSKDAARRFFESVREESAPAVVLPLAAPVAEPDVLRPQTMVEVASASLWDTRAALEANYGRIVKLADQLDAGIQVTTTNGGEEYTTYTPVATTVAAIKEIRGHVETSMDLMRLLVDVDEVRKFQASVIEAIGEADPATQQRIIAKLRERRSVGSTLFGS